MIKRGDHIFLRLDKNGVYLNEQELVKAERVVIGLSTPRRYSPGNVPKWIEVQVYEYQTGILDCNIVSFNRQNNDRFYNQTIPSDSINKLILCGSNTAQMLKLAGADSSGTTSGGSASSTRSKTQTPGFNRAYTSSAGMASSASPNRPAPEPVELPVTEHRQEYKFNFDEMRIVEGAAVFKTCFTIPKYYRPVELELRVENDFLCPEFDSIKGYLSNVLNRKTVEVTATIRCKGAEVVSVEAQAPLVLQITPDLLEEVKYRYIRRKLREVEDEAVWVTVDDLFDKVKESGLQPSDRQFVDDLIAIKKLKHAEHVRYLSDMHLHDLTKLRMQTKPFAFVCLVSGWDSCFFVLETLDKKDATYLWRLDAAEEAIRQNQHLISKALSLMEQEISLIRDHGRDPYRKDAPDNFRFIQHDYLSEDGFSTWKSRLRQVLDESISATDENGSVPQ